MTTNCSNDISNMASELSPLDKSVNDECRLCFSDTKSDFLNLFQSWAEPWEDMATTIAEDLYRLANIHVTELDIHSKVICCKCYIKLREACQFVRCIQKNNSMLKHKLISNDFKINHVGTEQWPQPIEVSKNVNDVINYQNIVIEVKKEVVTEEDENVNNGYPELEIKIEPEELQEQDRRVVKVIHGDIGEFTDSDNRNFEPEFLDNTLKEHASTDNMESQLVESQLQFNECMLCSKSFKTISGLKAHVISQHSYKTVKRKPATGNLLTPERKKRSHVCAICRRSFLTSSDLMSHETCHNTTVCCNRKFNSFVELSKHMRTCTKKRDSNELVSLESALSRTTANGIKGINLVNNKNSTTNKN